MTDAGGKPRVVYVSYDGVGEPLGRSQVLSYLYRLAGEYDITLVSFEKTRTGRAALRAELSERGIRWLALPYHKRPPLLSTVIDVAAGAVALVALAWRHGYPDIVHVRSYVPALMAVLARRITAGSLVFDIRGFWVDERVDGGIWPRESLTYGLVYRVAKRSEGWLFGSADAIVTLTHASVPQIRMWLGSRTTPVVVIPTCTDVERFAASAARDDGPHLTWCGSVGTWYRFDLAGPLAQACGRPLDVITRQPEAARKILGPTSARIRSLDAAEVPTALHAGDIGLSLCVGSFSKTASAPTRFAEYLASGMPVIVNRGVGDLAQIVEEHDVGVVLDGEDAESIEQAARQALALAAKPEVQARCRLTALQLFDVDAGARRYADLYQRLLGR
jgi:glycosyltransferase involved in cell wall biosynthesis